MPKKSRRSGHVRPKPPLISLDEPGRLRTSHVLAVTGWSHSTLYARIHAQKWPPPQKDGCMNFWNTATVKSALSL